MNFRVVYRYQLHFASHNYVVVRTGIDLLEYQYQYQSSPRLLFVDWIHVCTQILNSTKDSSGWLLQIVLTSSCLCMITTGLFLYSSSCDHFNFSNMTEENPLINFSFQNSSNFIADVFGIDSSLYYLWYRPLVVAIICIEFYRSWASCAVLFVETSPFWHVCPDECCCKWFRRNFLVSKREFTNFCCEWVFPLPPCSNRDPPFSPGMCVLSVTPFPCRKIPWLFFAILFVWVYENTVHCKECGYQVCMVCVVQCWLSLLPLVL